MKQPGAAWSNLVSSPRHGLVVALRAAAVFARAPRQSSTWLLSILCCGTALRLLLAPSNGYLGVDGDLIEHKQAIHRALTLGFHTVYSANAAADPALTGREWDGGYFFNNLPVILYVRSPAIAAYRAFEPRGFDLWRSDLNYFELERRDLTTRLASSRGFTVALKLPCIVADGVISIVIFFVARSASTANAALASAAFYALNPGVILNTGFWGQHDSIWIALTVAALVLLQRGYFEAAWASYALAALTKPQAWALAPLMLVATAAWSPASRLLRALGTAAATAALVFLPFLVRGTWLESLTSIAQSTLGGEPFVSCNALNFWWLATAGRGYEFPDTTRLAGHLSARAVGLGLVVLANAVALWPLARGKVIPATHLMRVAAFVYLGFFVFATELHENHSVAAIALLAAAASIRPLDWGVCGALSAVLLANIVIFDPALSGRLDLLRIVGRPVTIAASALSVATLLGLWVRLRRTHPASRDEMRPGTAN